MTENADYKPLPTNLQLFAPLLDASRSSIDGGGSPRGSTRLSVIARCEQEYAYRYFHGHQTPHEPHYRLTGSLIHVCLAYYFADKIQHCPKPRWFYAETLEQALLRRCGNREDIARLAQNVFVEWMQWYMEQPDATDYQTLCVEQLFEAPVGALDPAAPPELAKEVVTVRVDRLKMHTRDGYLVVDDFKGRGYDPFAERYNRLADWTPKIQREWSYQVMLYLHVLRAVGLPVQREDIMRIKRASPFDFAINPMSVSRVAYAAVPAMVTARVRRDIELQRALTDGYVPTKSLDACFAKFPCDYVPICHADSTDDQYVQLQLMSRK